MSIRSIKEIYQLLEQHLRKATRPMTCADLMDNPEIREEALAEYGKDIRIATNKLSDALGLMWRRNLLVRYPAPRETNTLARYAYSWDTQKDTQASAPIPSPVISRKTNDSRLQPHVAKSVETKKSRVTATSRMRSWKNLNRSARNG